MTAPDKLPRNFEDWFATVKATMRKGIYVDEDFARAGFEAGLMAASQPDLDEDMLVELWAGHALQGILTHGASYGHIDGKGDPERLTELALAYADTMLAAYKARRKP